DFHVTGVQTCALPIYAPFVQAEFTGIDNLTVTGGLRHEESQLVVDDFTTLASAGSRFVEGGKPEFSETLHNLGGTYQVSEAWRQIGRASCRDGVQHAG